MENYVLKCETCGAILEDAEFDICTECEYKESKTTTFNKRSREVFRNYDNKKIGHRTKKRQTKPRKEVTKDV